MGWDRNLISRRDGVESFSATPNKSLDFRIYRDVTSVEIYAAQGDTGMLKLLLPLANLWIISCGVVQSMAGQCYDPLRGDFPINCYQLFGAPQDDNEEEKEC